MHWRQPPAAVMACAADTALASAEPHAGPGPVQAALLASLPALVLLVVTPARIYIGNQPHFDHRYALVLHLGLLYVLVVLVLYVLFRAAPRLRIPIGYSLGLVGTFIFGVSVLAPSPVDELVGGGIRGIETSPVSVLLDVALLLVLGALVRLTPAPTLVRVACVFSVLAAALVPAAVLFEAARAEEPVIDWAVGERPGPASVADSPNVYHLVFDGFDATVFGRILAELDLAPVFTGFVWYENARSNYTSTRLSFSSFMTGRVFDETITDEEGGRIGRTEGLVRTLGANGYTVTQYNGYFVNNHVLTHVRHSTPLLEDRLYGRLRHLVQILDLSILLSAPTVLKAHTAIDGRGLAGHVLARGPRSLADWTRNGPVLNRMLFDGMTADEAARPARGQYINAHFLLPHTPHVLSAECEYQPERFDSRVTLVAQSMCTVAKITEFVELLRLLGRFRDAMIVIHSDHGTLHRYRPLLMVKAPGRAAEEFETALEVVQLADVAPTIQSTLDLDLTGLDGIPLDDTPGVTREIDLWAAKPSLK